LAIGHDELTRPLGMEPDARPARRWPARVAVGIYAVVAIVVVALLGWLALMRDPLGGQPYAVAVIDRKPLSTPAPPQPAAEAAHGTPATAEPPAKTEGPVSASELEDSSGVKVVRQGGGAAPGAVVIHVPSPDAVRLAPAPDKRLVERSKHGTLPKVGADGARPAEVYARPVPPAVAARQTGRIAIVVGGLGLSPSATADAIAKLPGAVTLAFAPYGSDLDRQVSRAREDGHEVMLQVPMEPFDYPDNDPGPHTLMAEGTSQENIDRLHWTMSRFPGYIGLVNYMGAKFTSSDAALGPVLKDVADRGLLFLDDGSSGRSRVGVVAEAANLPAARADGLVDATSRPAAIDAELSRLETMARDKGLVIATASALPVTIDRIAQWAKSLESKGLVLIPVSAAVAGRAAKAQR
jgi:polysaccharide deacetylase 2 family uncharacterized protein YibQ